MAGVLSSVPGFSLNCGLVKTLRLTVRSPARSRRCKCARMDAASDSSVVSRTAVVACMHAGGVLRRGGGVLCSKGVLSQLGLLWV